MEIMKLESTILSVAHRALAEFKSYAEDGLLDEAMMRFHEIGGLAILGRIQNSGVSKETAAELDRVEREANRTFANFAKANQDGEDTNANNVAVEEKGPTMFVHSFKPDDTKLV